MPKKPGEPRLKRAVDVLRPANEPDRGHAVPIGLHRRLRGSNQTGIIGQPQIVVGAEVQKLAPRHLDMRALRPVDQPLSLHQPFGLDPLKHGSQMRQERRPPTFRHTTTPSVIAELLPQDSAEVKITDYNPSKRIPVILAQIPSGGPGGEAPPAVSTVLHDQNGARRRIRPDGVGPVGGVAGGITRGQILGLIPAFDAQPALDHRQMLAASGPVGV